MMPIARRHRFAQQSRARRSASPKLQDTAGAVHLMGLLSPGGVHSHQDHIAATRRACWRTPGCPSSCMPSSTDATRRRKSALGFVEKFEQMHRRLAGVRIATVSGRYYAMDRDKRWDRVKLAYDAIVDARGGIARRYRRSRTRRVLRARTSPTSSSLPTVIGAVCRRVGRRRVAASPTSAPTARARFRWRLLDPQLRRLRRCRACSHFCRRRGLTEYSEPLKAAWRRSSRRKTSARPSANIVAELGLKQLRIAETEKYAHVTFFLNGGREEPFAGEDRILVPSPKVATYDLKPEMSAL